MRGMRETDDMTTNTSTPTARQIDFAATLLTERHGFGVSEAEAHATRAAEIKNRREYSAWIDRLLATRTPAPSDRPTYEAEPNEFHVIDEVIYRTRSNRARTRVYAQRAFVYGSNVSWRYAAGVIRRISADTRISVEQAREFGHATGRCVFCSHVITTDESLAVGYGPVCADRQGLPWGDVTAEQRIIRQRADQRAGDRIASMAQEVVEQMRSSRQVVDDADECPGCGDEFISPADRAQHDCALVQA